MMDVINYKTLVFRRVARSVNSCLLSLILLSFILVGARSFALASSPASTHLLVSGLLNAPPAAWNVPSSLELRVAGTTSTQAILRYTAPDRNPCTVRVSENVSLSPLVHDVDPHLFPGSSSDGGGAAQRQWVIGRRTVAQARDGKNYSRALQANTAHYFELRCGTVAARGSFTTTNIPVGKTFAEPQVLDPAGNYIFPSVPDVRGYAIIDPRTGALVRRVTLAGDSIRPTTEWSSGNFHVCSDIMSHGGYHCAILTHGGRGVLYWINPSDGSSRLLGTMSWPAGADYQPGSAPAGTGSMFDAANPDVYYALGRTPPALGPPRTVIMKGTYKGQDREVSRGASAAMTWVNLTPAAGHRTLSDLITAFDSRYSPSLFPNCNLRNVQSHYLLMVCSRYFQDSPAWNVIGDVSNGFRIVAAQQMYANPQSRWCGVHNQMYLGNIAYMNIVSQDPQSRGTGGPYVVSLKSAAGKNDSLLAVSGEPQSTLPPPDGVTFLQNDAPGDVFVFMDGTNERVKITSKQTPTSLVVQRGYGGTHPAVHAPGAQMRTTCNASKGVLFWDFIHDPHGVDATGTYYYPDNPREHGGHRAFLQPHNSPVAWDVMEGWLIRTGYPMPQLFKEPPSFYVEVAPSFAGFVAGNNSNGYMEHPSYDQVLAPPAEQLWFLDVTPFLGLPYADSAIPISGSLYKLNFAASHAFTPTLPYFAMSNAHYLRDVSGPNSLLSGQAADSYKFCVAKRGGECQPGSAPGNVYFNVPGLARTKCAGSAGAAPRINDICINNLASWGEALVQIGLTADQTGSNPNDHFPVYGGKGAKSRVLVSGTSLGKYRLLDTYANAHSLPDGSWALFASQLANLDDPSGANDIYVVKIPPTPKGDRIDRSTYINVPVSTQPVAGAMSAQVRYGYEENGPRSSFYCTQRPEPCVISGSPGSTVNLPGISQRIIFYNVTYVDRSGRIVAASSTEARAIP